MLVPFAVAVAVVLLSIWWFRKPKTVVSQPPAPPGIPGPKPSDPTQGNFPDMGKAGSLHEYLCALHDEYGPVVAFHWGTTRVVSVASESTFRELARLFDRPTLLFSLFKPLIGDGECLCT